MRVLDRTACTVAAEDMIITKVRWAVGAGRTKDRDDIRDVMEVSGSEFDWADTEAVVSETRHTGGARRHSRAVAVSLKMIARPCPCAIVR